MNIKFLLLIGIILEGMTGCQTEKINVQKEWQDDNTEMWEIRISKPFFSSSASLECKAINHRVTALIDSLKNDFKMQVKDYNQAFDTIPNEEPMRPLEMFVKDSVFVADGNYISLRFEIYVILGGANGETKYYTLNYDLRIKCFLSNGEILNLKQEDEIDRLLKQVFKNPDNCFTEVPTVAACSALNFTGENLCFTYGKYVLGAGACGDVEVNIPFDMLDNLLLINNM